MEKYEYYCNCVRWDRSDVNALSDMIDKSVSISRRSFLRHVNRLELQAIEASLGYQKHHMQGLTMAMDCHVDYRHSKLHGERVYMFVWSGIEYVFTKK